MKIYILTMITLVSVLLTGCTRMGGLKNIEYIKVITLGYPDSLTQFNKGSGLEQYFHLTPANDSLVYRSASYHTRTLPGNP